MDSAIIKYRTLATAVMAGFFVGQPAAAQTHPLACALSLTSCEEARTADGTCPVGQPTSLRLYQDADTFYFSATNVLRNLSGEDGGSLVAELTLHQNTPHQSYFIMNGEEFSGAFTYEPAGDALLTLVLTLSEEYFETAATFEERYAGTCVKEE